MRSPFNPGAKAGKTGDTAPAPQPGSVKQRAGASGDTHGPATASGMGPPAVASPKGGGALRGIGEKFQANPASGTASLEIPLQIPAGRGELGPVLSLQYGSGNGNGPFGLGWTLSAPGISRKTDKGVPRYGDGDTFILAGAEDLVVMPGPAAMVTLDGVEWRIARYRPRVEAGFQRIERWHEATGRQEHWRITDQRNITAVYGTSAQSRIADPQDPLRVFSWLLAEVRDDRGNVVVYRYKSEDASGIDPEAIHERQRFDSVDGRFLAGAQRYLKTVLYGNAKAPDDLEAGSHFRPINEAAVAGQHWCFHLVFDYGEHGSLAPADDLFVTDISYRADQREWCARSDAFSNCRPGFELRTYRRCQRVLVFHHFEDLDPAPVCVSQQVLSYDASAHLSRLLAFECHGLVRDGAGRLHGDRGQAIPALRLTYSDAAAAVHFVAQGDGGAQPAPAVMGAPFRWADLDGEGVPGALWATGEGWHYRRNLGDGVLAAPVLVQALPSARALGQDGAQLLDLDADGRLELAWMAPPLAGFHSRSAGGDWLPRQLFSSVPHIDWDDPNLRFVDLTGDGLADILITRDDALVWLQSLGSKGFDAARRRLHEADESKGPQGLFSNGKESLLLADMNGDGLVDLVRVRLGSVCYWPSLGHGRFGAKVTLACGAWFDSAQSFDPQRIHLADVDGSGTTDLIYLEHDRALIYANQSGNRLLAAREVMLPRFDNQARVDVIDVLGKGTACLVWSSPLPAERRQALRIIDLMGGVKPHLLTHIDNGFGGTTQIDYASSATQYLADRAAGRPWLTRLAFPVQVVVRVVKADSVAGTELTTTYEYRHGYFDGREREFRGFGFVEQRDAEVFAGSPGAAQELEQRPAAVMRTWFHTGAWLPEKSLEQLFVAEYFGAATAAPPSEGRDATRALKGRPLRVEIYATAIGQSAQLAPCPCAVTEHRYSAVVLQQQTDVMPAVVQVRMDETLQSHYEEDFADPRVTHELVLRYDDFGQPIRTARLAYARRSPKALAVQQRCLGTVTESLIVNDTGSAIRYRLGVPVAETRYELVAVPAPADGMPWRPAALDQTYDALGEIDAATVVGKRLVGAGCSSYWHDDLKDDALKIGQVGRRAIVRQRFELAFDENSVAQILTADAAALDLLDNSRAELGYVRTPPADPATTAGFPLPSAASLWWRPSGELRPDRNHFFVPEKYTDAFGAVIALGHDRHALLLLRTEDARGNVTMAEMDYRVLSARSITDPNGNETVFAYENNGKLRASALLGKGEGDTLEDPTLEYRYFLCSPLSPMCVQTVEREQHVNARLHRSDVRRTRIEYTDGSGRVALVMLEAEPGPAPLLGVDGQLQYGQDGRSILTEAVPRRWVGSGRVVYDNKGNPVRQYEPFFWPDSGFPAQQALRQWGVSPALHYDALNRLVRTDKPDGSCTCVRFSPWHVERWDENDTVLGAPVAAPAAPELTWHQRMLAGSAPQQEAARKAAAHAATPHTEHVDALGRVCIQSTPERDPAQAGQAPFIYTTVQELDSDGRVLAITDPMGRIVSRTRYDLLGRALSSWLADSGTRWQLSNAADQPAREWSERGLAWRVLYDTLRRPTHRYVRWPVADDPRDPVRPLRNGGAQAPGQEHRGRELLAERLYYGEDIARQEARDANLLGRLAGRFDDAGFVHCKKYDLKGNLTEHSRKLTRAFRAHADWSPIAYATDRYQAQVLAAGLLETREFRIVDYFDARNRNVERQTPDGRSTLSAYNEAGLLESVRVREADGSPERRVIDNIDYNARGQRIRIAYGKRGSGAYQVFTRYSYDPLTFRLQELCSWRDGLGTHPYQQLAYTYDPVGNITAIVNGGARRTFAWNAGPGIVDGNQSFTYDALYQLTQASGREHPAAVAANDNPLRDHAEHAADLTALRRYTEQFEYDRNGNLVKTRHAAGASGWTLAQTYQADTNRIKTVGAGLDKFEYLHDAHGNLVAMPHLAQLDWDGDDRLKLSARNAEQLVWFAYDAAGQRVRKVFEAGGTVDETVYIGGYELHTRRTGRRKRELGTLRVMDDQSCVAIIDSVLADDFGELERGSGLRYQLADHLGSVAVECDESGAAVSCEEFRAFGTTAFSTSSAAPGSTRRRYRLTGKERDEETGLHYFGARYYASWLARWISADPALLSDGLNRYGYCRNNPSSRFDPNGCQSNPADLSMMWHQVSVEWNAMHSGVFGGEGGLDINSNTLNPQLPRGGMGGLVGGFMREATMRTIPIESNPTNSSLQGMEMAATQVSILNPLNTVIHGESVTGRPASRVDATIDLTIDMVLLAISLRPVPTSIGIAEVRTTKSTTRLGGRPGEKGVTFTYYDGREFDMTAQRVKEEIPNPYRLGEFKPKIFDKLISIKNDGKQRAPIGAEFTWFKSIPEKRGFHLSPAPDSDHIFRPQILLNRELLNSNSHGSDGQKR